MDLYTALKNYTYTENGALTHESTGSRVLDLFGQGGAFRARPDADIKQAVTDAFIEEPLRTLETLFYLRDIRGGQGEKRVFRVGIKALLPAVQKLGTTNDLFDAIVELGSWKDIFDYFEFNEWKDYFVLKHRDHQKAEWEAKKDIPDLMYKWAPSIGGSKNGLAEKLASYLNESPRAYRKMLTKERAKLKLVETNMCSNTWESIDYEHIPSRAGFLYREAFSRHDGERYRQFIRSASDETSSTKINTGTLYPYEIIEKYVKEDEYYCTTISENPALEAFWKNLPIYGNSDKNAIVVADTSGSMYGRPLSIATSLAVYFAQHNKGKFHNKWITFSQHPNFYEFHDGDSLCDIITPFYELNICDNTNLQAVFDLILRVAKENKLPESELPENIVIVSDMEFDIAQGTSKTNFEVIKEKYKASGYSMPKLVFWNVNSHKNNVPVTMNEQGVILVSGASPSLFEMIIGQETNPYQFMLSVIDKKRYQNYAKKVLGL